MNNSTKKIPPKPKPVIMEPLPNELICNACLWRESNAPVEAIITKNCNSLLRRHIMETNEEIKNVMTRVNNIYSSLLQTETESIPDDLSFPSFEYISDIHQLQNILKDEVKKQLYRDQVTVFIVGYAEQCEQKLKLINQLNEFFIINSKVLIDDAWEETLSDDFDLDTVSQNVTDSITTAARLTNRLSEINKEMVQNSTNQLAAGAANLKFKGKKKLEKALQQAKDEINGLQEKGKQMLSDIEYKEEQLSELTKQLEIKSKECQELKIAASLTYQYLTKIQVLEEDGKEKNGQIDDLQNKVCKLESNINDLKLSQVKPLSKLESLIKHNEETILELKEKIENDVIDQEEALEAADSFHQIQIQDLSINHREEIVQLEMNQEKVLIELTEAKGSHKESSQKGTSTKKSKSVSKQKSKDSKTGKSSKKKDVKESSDSTQGNGAGAKEKGESASKTAKTQSKLSKTVKQAPVETAVDHSVLETLDAFELTDNEAWSGLPSEQMPERFVQYRWLTTKKLKELDEQLKLMTLRTQRKVDSLKSQFQEHKVKWEEERDLLKQQVVQLKGLQVAAEKEADAVMTQLEDFINEQEKMETNENVDNPNINEESTSIVRKNSDLQHTNKEEHAHNIQLESKQSMPTTKEIDYSIANSSNIDSLRPKTGNLKIIEPINTPDAKPKSSITSAADICTFERNEVNNNKGELSMRKNDAKLPLVGMQVDDQEISVDLSNDNDKNPKDTEESIKTNGDSTDAALSNQMYRIILQFQENLTKLVGHKDVNYDKENVADIDSITDEENSHSGAETQSDDVFKRIQKALKDVTHLIYDQFQQQQVDQLPPLETEISSTDNQRQNGSTTISDKSGISNKVAMRELMDLYNQLQCQIIEDTRKHETEQRHNTAVMMEMEEKITSLQQQLELTRKIQGISLEKNPQDEPPVMFTRLDLERNAKIMTRAVSSQHISDQKYKNILQQMADYISLPVLRFQQLVKRYIHHCRLKHIYEYIKHNSQFNQQERGEGTNRKQTFLLQKVATAHNQYVNRWCEEAAVMSVERQSQANALTETLDELEAESGLFLIKPIYTNRSKSDVRDKKLHRKKNIGNKIPSNYSHLKQTSMANSIPTTIPYDHFSKNNFVSDSSDSQQEKPQAQTQGLLAPNCNRQQHVSTPMWAISMSQSSYQNNQKEATGDFHDSIPKTTEDSVRAYDSMLTAPRILELDINRMLIGQNNVSIKIDQPVSNESSQLHLRSYLSVCRPTASQGNRVDWSTLPLSNITNSYHEMKTPSAPRLCTLNPYNAGTHLVQIEESPAEEVRLPPIFPRVLTQTSIANDK